MVSTLPPARTVPLRFIDRPGAGVTKVSTERLFLSPLHRRSTWGDLERLAKSLARRQIHPLVVRESDAEGDAEPMLEVVAGARRLKAAALAGLTTLDVVIQVLTDEDVVDAQLEENGRRHDLHPIDEADLFHELVTRGRAIESIAVLQGIPVKAVVARLQLCRLHPTVRQMYVDGVLTDFAAFAVSRIPSVAKQEEAAAAIERQAKLGPALADAVITDIVRRHFHMALARAPWDRDAEVAGVDAPACRQCPKRTLAQRELFDDFHGGGGAVGKRDDHCTDVSCWSLKLDAHWAETQRAAQDAGHAVLTKRESAGLFMAYAEIGKTLKIRPDGPYVDTEDPYDGANGRTWGEAAAVVPQVLVRDPDGMPRWLMPSKEARHALAKTIKAAKKAAKAEETADGHAPAPAQAELESETAKQEKAAARAARRKADAVHRAVIDAAVASSPDVNPSGIIMALAPVAAAAMPDAYARICKRAGGDPADWLRDAKKGGFRLLCQLLVEVLLDEAADQADALSDAVMKAAKELGADVGKAKRAAEDQ